METPRRPRAHHLNGFAQVAARDPAVYAPGMTQVPKAADSMHGPAKHVVLVGLKLLELRLVFEVKLVRVETDRKTLNTLVLAEVTVGLRRFSDWD